MLVAALSTLVLVVAGTIFTVHSWCLVQLWWKMKQFKGPKALPVIGNLMDLSEIPPTSYYFFQRVYVLTREWGNLARFWMGHIPVLVVSDGPTMETVLSSTKLIDKAFNYRFLIPWLGTGLLTSTGRKWRSRRKIITPAFHFKILEEFIETFNTNGRILVEKLKSKVGQPEFDVSHYVTLCTLDVICETAMGVKVNAQQDSESEYVKAVKTVADSVIRRSISPWLFVDFIYWLTPSGRQEKKALKVLHNTTYQVINKKKAEFKAKQLNRDDDRDDVGAKQRMAFLDLLLQYSQEVHGLSDSDIREEVDTFMFEGHDTTTSAISFAIYCLSHHPDVQDKALKEQQDMFGNSERAATYQDLQDMKYLELVIKETLRMFPSVPIIGREVMEDIKMGDRTCPKGCNLFLNIFAMQRDEAFFRDPFKFDPDRFLREQAVGRHPYVFVPFSAGPRNCIGQKFAMLEMKSTLSRVIRAFTLLPSSAGFDDTTEHLTLELILKSTKGVNVRLEARG